MARLVLVPVAQLDDQRQVVGELLGRARRGGAGAASTAAWRATASSRSALVPATMPEPADDPRQRQALPDQRGEDDAVGQVDDQVAVRHGERERQGGGQRDHAAHPGPRHDEDRRRGRVGALARIFGAQPPREVGRREDPHDPRDDDRQADRDPEADQLGGARAAAPARIDGQLQADQQEGEAVDQEDHRCSRRRGPASRPSGDRARAAFRPAMTPAVTVASTPLSAERLGRQVGDQRRQQRQRDLERRVGRPPPGRDDRGAR